MKSILASAAATGLALAALFCGCGGEKSPSSEGILIGAVTDVGGRGDQSFIAGTLRGLEIWACGVKYEAGKYLPATAEEIALSVKEHVVSPPFKITPFPGLRPQVIESKAPEDYARNISMLIRDGAKLIVGIGYMLENAIEEAAKKYPEVKFVLIDIQIQDEQNRPYILSNVRTYTFRENESCFLVGAVAGLITRTGKVSFIGGMKIPLIQRFEAGFRAGLRTVNPEAEKKMLVYYTGKFDDQVLGRQGAEQHISSGADVLFHAAGLCGVGVIEAAYEHNRIAIGCDSNQSSLAPNNVVTSALKHTDLAVYIAVKDFLEGRFEGGNVDLGLKEGGLEIAPLALDIPPLKLSKEEKQKIRSTIASLQQMVISGKLKVPASLEELRSFRPPAIR
jgi:basic membrane protein A